MNKQKKSSYRIPKQLAEDIADLAESVADEHCPAECVQPETIAQKKRITLSYNSYGESFDGMLEHKSGRFHIYVNLDRVETRYSSRARFTLGHELGHYFIDDHRNALAAGAVPKHPSVCEYESTNPVEVQADFFASNLLMPKSRFVKKAKRQFHGLPGIIELAKLFDTSITATALRYVTLGIHPSIIIKWNPDGFGWKWISEDAFQTGYRKTEEDSNNLPVDCPTRLAMSGEPMPPKGCFEKGSTASMWFPSCRPGTPLDVVLKEQAMQLGRFGTLTVLIPDSGTFPTRCN